MNSITITISLPPKEVSQNARCHWRKKGPITKKQRQASFYAALAAVRDTNNIPATMNVMMPCWERASLKVRAYFPTRMHADPLNFLGSLKASADGLQDSGLIANDRYLFPERPEFYTDAKNPRVELVITKEE